MSSVSQILRQTREEKGITLEEVAQRTYIKLPYLVALEEGDIEKLPAPVYIHGYIRQYAKLLGLNGSELVLQYQQDAGRPSVAAPKLNLTPKPMLQAAPEPALPDEPPTFIRSPLPPDLREPSLERTISAMPPDLRETSLSQNGSRSTSGQLPPDLREISLTRAPEPAVMGVSLPAAEDSVRRVEAPPAPYEIQQAKMQAHQIISSAQREAQELRIAAERYADQVLAQLESEVNRSLQTVRNGRAFLQSRRRKLQET